MRSLIFVLFLGTTSLFACQQSGEPQSGSVPSSVDVETARQYVENGAVLVDVRTPEEWNAGHLEGAVHINLFDSDFEERFAALDTTKTYVVYCRSGNRSGQAIQKMKSRGFSKLTNMEGGIIAWERQDFPIVTD